MFLIEGIITGVRISALCLKFPPILTHSGQVIGVISWFYLPASPYQTKGSLRGKNGWFTHREEVIQVNRILRDDPSKGDMHNRQAVSPKLLWQSLKDYDMWPIYLMSITQYVPQGAPQSYLTITIRSIGFDTFNTNLLTIPSSVLYIINVCVCSLFSLFLSQLGFKNRC
jgi:hypothetical protein